MLKKLIRYECECEVFSLYRNIKDYEIGLTPDNLNLTWMIHDYCVDSCSVLDLVERVNKAADTFFFASRYNTKRFFFIKGIRVERVFTGTSNIYAFPSSQFRNFLNLSF